ncbi:MAG: hypothetical protein AAGM22_05265 [Acidobacteriota bacterium]
MPADAAASSRRTAWRLRPWSARSVLRAWERGDGLERTARALAVLSVALPEASRGDLLDLPLGRRDQLLLQCRVDLLGETLQGSVHCPACGAEQAFSLEVSADLLSQSVALDAPERAELELDGRRVIVRIPTCRDALAVEGLRPTAARRELLRRAVAFQEKDSELVEFSPAAAEELGETFERLDPLALVPLALGCSGCGFEWQPLLEVVEIVWAEIENLAGRLLDEAQTLADAYGWSEAEILAMSGRRRRYYLEKAPSSAAVDEESPRPLPGPAPWSPT